MHYYLPIQKNDRQAKLCTKGDSWQLLIVDGHNSHFSTEFISSCKDHQVELLCHLIQLIYYSLCYLVLYSKGADSLLFLSHGPNDYYVV